MYLLNREGWYLERIILLMAGSFTLISSILAWAHSPWWLIWTMLVGLNLVVFAMTGFCPMAVVLNKLGIKPRLQRSQK